MTHETFWSLIEESHTLAHGDDNAQCKILQGQLEQLPATEIQSFDQIYDEMRMASYDNRLWAAAYIINGGCSDDGFEYFRGWLISRGQKVFDAALQDPGSLAEVITHEEGEGDFELEEMLYIARRAYEKKTGQEMPPGPKLQWELKGPHWDEDTVDDLYPRLAQVIADRES